MIYEIKTPSIVLKLTIVEVDKLYIHEEIIPDMLRRLVESIRRDGVFRNPVIVDEKTLVVLDGMHRVAAAKELGLKYIPVCLVDYMNPSIGLYSWARVIKSRRRATREDYSSIVIDTIGKLGYRFVSIPGIDEAKVMLSRRELVAVVFAEKSMLGVKTRSRDIKAIYDDLKRIEEALSYRGFLVEYHTENDALKLVESGEAVAALMPPAITKEEVINVALSGRVFTHKSTRHVIPARPMNIDVPLSHLTGELPLEEANKFLIDSLSRRKLKVLPPGSVIDRRYEEEVYLFE